MVRPGDVVTVDFPGITGVKRRPAVVLSTELYHRTRPDVVLGLITSQTGAAVQPSDYLLQDWAETGLRRLSAFRTFLVTMPASAVMVIGHLSDRDWQGVRRSLQQALSVSNG
jgi:mRNA interferase MazF